jgi:hypothetical protein
MSFFFPQQCCFLEFFLLLASYAAATASWCVFRYGEIVVHEVFTEWELQLEPEMFDESGSFDVDSSFLLFVCGVHWSTITASFGERGAFSISAFFLPETSALSFLWKGKVVCPCFCLLWLAVKVCVGFAFCPRLAGLKLEVRLEVNEVCSVICK